MKQNEAKREKEKLGEKPLEFLLTILMVFTIQRNAYYADREKERKRVSKSQQFNLFAWPIWRIFASTQMMEIKFKAEPNRARLYKLMEQD